jgi:DNA-binding response OmpR family regulator
MEADRLPVDDPERPPDGGADQPYLTPTEARLLEVLRGQPGRVFSRAELVALVMPDAVVLERTVDVHVKALRRKLGTLGRQVETVRKAGYRYAAEAPPAAG